MTAEEKLGRILAVLAVPARLRILQLLKDGALCVNAITSRLDISQGAVSQHLRIMRQAGLVIPERRGCYVHYGLNEKTVKMWRQALGAFLDVGLKREEEGGRPCVAKGKRRCAANRKS